MTNYAARLADDADPLRSLLRAARSWRVAPSVFIGQRLGIIYEHDAAGRAIRAVEWIGTDTDLAMALEDYEAGLCPGCQQPLEETSRQDHADAYQPEEPIRCHYCTTQALISKKAEEDHEKTAGLLYPIKLNPDVVEQNRQPIPPLPPEWGSTDGQ